MTPSEPITGPIAALDPPWPIEGGARRRLFFIPFDQWGMILGVAGIVAVSCVSLYEKDSMWIGLGLFVFVAVLMHTLLAARQAPWIPGLIVIMAMIQWVLATWASYHYIPELPVFSMVLPADDYFSYAVPAACLLMVGLYLPLWGIGKEPLPRRAKSPPPTFSRTCDLMIVVGLIAVNLTYHLPNSLWYAMTLVGSLSFVGAFGQLLVQTRGWWWRVLIVLGMRLASSTENGLFHDLLLWGTYAGLLAVFVYRPRITTIVGLAAIAMFFVGSLNEAKHNYRKALMLNPGMPLSDRVSLLAGGVFSQASAPHDTFTGDAGTRLITRLNQGWIIARIMAWVPTSEPYARGETLTTAFRAALLPRILDPGKYEAGGAINFPRFTGLTISGGTSMNLSPAGEMYANFGHAGGLFAMLLFGVALGLLYRMFAGWAQGSPLWWAWAPYVMLYTMQAENGIGEGVNHVAKSTIVMLAVVYYLPAWRALRRWRPRQRHTMPALR
jgi:hypothetical protein